MRPDNSQDWGNGASRPGLSAVVAQFAAMRDQPAPLGRESRLGDALAGLAQDLAVARRQIGVLKRERAVANTLGFAPAAAARGDFSGALEWLGVVEIVDGGVPPGWERTRALWLRGERSAEVGLELPTAGAETAEFREGAG